MDVVLQQPRIVSGTERALAASGLAAIAGGSAAVWYFDPVNAGFFPVCPLLATTGFACPGCGLTRGFHALFHGDVITALDYNALLPLVALFILGIVATLISVAVRGRGLGINIFRPSILFGILGLLVAFGVLRNLPFFPFSVLYP
jgi:hypothetical protein